MSAAQMFQCQASKALGWHVLELPASFSAKQPRTADVFLCLAGWPESWHATSPFKLRISVNFWSASYKKVTNRFDEYILHTLFSHGNSWKQNHKKVFNELGMITQNYKITPIVSLLMGNI